MSGEELTTKRGTVRRTGLILAACCALLLSACAPQAPQQPSRRTREAPKVDSAQLALMELNQQLTFTANEQLAELAMAQEDAYALYEAGVWMHITDAGDPDSPFPQPGEERVVVMRTYDLGGTLRMDTEGTYRIGKHELPEGVDRNIGELHNGGKARMLVPWYSAYGIKGNSEIEPYENVIIEIELK